MANLIITNGCNLHCPFCFASEYRQETFAEMDWAEFCWQIDFINSDTIRFCGGEPTLHSHFQEMVEYILNYTNKNIFIMTNGLWPQKVHDFIKKLSFFKRRRLYFMVNILPKNFYSTREAAGLESNLKILPAAHTTLAITIYNRAPDFSYHFELLQRFKIKQLRYSLAAPNISDQRSWHFSPEKDFPQLGIVLTELLKTCLARGIFLQSDCGYLPRCYWPAAGLKLLETITAEQADISFNCQGPLDIGTSGQAWRCFGLLTLSAVQSRHYHNCAELAAHFEQTEPQFRRHHLRQECQNCQEGLTGRCGGGCLALRHTLALKERARQNGFDLADDLQLLECRPQIISQKLKLFTFSKRQTFMQNIDGEWEEINFPQPLAIILTRCDGEKKLAEILNIAGLNSEAALILPKIRQLYSQEFLTLSY